MKKLYGGYVDGKLDTWCFEKNGMSVAAVFSNKNIARKYYADVRPITIRELTKKARRK